MYTFYREIKSGKSAWLKKWPIESEFKLNFFFKQTNEGVIWKNVNNYKKINYLNKKIEIVIFFKYK